MTDDRVSSLLAHAVELERRDLALADQLTEVSEVAEDVGMLRARAAEIDTTLGALPGDRAAAASAAADADTACSAALTALEAAEARLAALESGRRSRQDDVDQARRELTRAQEEAHDAAARAERTAARERELADLEQALRAEAEGLVVDARLLAARIQAIERVADVGTGDPGSSLAAIEEWGAQARAALFVTRSALVSERERVVIEANTLGSAVLGEPLGASSATLVRQRIERALAGS